MKKLTEKEMKALFAGDGENGGTEDPDLDGFQRQQKVKYFNG